ncbi:hypothetical protein D3C78_636340 [compost metagenome]
MANRVALVAVQHHFRLGGRARSEVQQHRVGGQGAALDLEPLAIVSGGAVCRPPRGRRANANPAAALTQADKLVQMGAADYQVANLATFDAVAQVLRGQQGRGRDDHGAKFEGGQHGFPEGDVVAEHQ